MKNFKDKKNKFTREARGKEKDAKNNIEEKLDNVIEKAEDIKDKHGRKGRKGERYCKGKI